MASKTVYEPVIPETINQHPFDQYLISLLNIGNDDDGSWKLEIQDQETNHVYQKIINHQNVKLMTKMNGFDSRMMFQVIHASFIQQNPMMTGQIFINAPKHGPGIMHLVMEQNNFASSSSFNCFLEEYIEIAEAKFIGSAAELHDNRNLISQSVEQLERQVAEMHNNDVTVNQKVIELEGKVNIITQTLSHFERRVTEIISNYQEELNASKQTIAKFINKISVLEEQLYELSTSAKQTTKLAGHFIDLSHNDINLSNMKLDNQSEIQLAQTLISHNCTHISSLDLSHNNMNFTYILDALATIGCSNLKKLIVVHNGASIYEPHIAHMIKIGTCPSLEILNLNKAGLYRLNNGDPYIGDAIGLGCCPKLRILILRGNSYTDGMSSLIQGLGAGGCPNLEILNLADCEIDTKYVQLLIQALTTGCCPKLQTIDMRNNIGVNFVGIQHLSSLKKLFPELNIIYC